MLSLPRPSLRGGPPLFPSSLTFFCYSVLFSVIVRRHDPPPPLRALDLSPRLQAHTSRLSRGGRIWGGGIPGSRFFSLPPLPRPRVFAFPVAAVAAAGWVGWLF